MPKSVAIDTGPLGQLVHPVRFPEIKTWLGELLQANIPVYIPEISYYELRRNLLLENLTRSLLHLEALKSFASYLPINSGAMNHAAELWAEARRKGHPTAAPHELDGDVILAAQALQVDAVIATDNLGHLNRFADARRWQSITPKSL